MVKVKLLGISKLIECANYKNKEDGIILYDAIYEGSLWGQVETFKNSIVFQNEKKLEPTEEKKEEDWTW